MPIWFFLISTPAAAPASSTTSNITAIAGGSGVGAVVIVGLLIVVIWCWKKDKCRRNGTITEKNEMYGQAQDYEEYDKDDYDTRIVDSNYMYEYDS